MNEQKDFTSLLKINCFQKNIKTKIKAPIHDSLEYCVPKIEKENNLINPIQDKLMLLMDNNFFEIQKRQFDTKIETKSDFDYSQKSIIEVKPQQDTSKLFDDIKKNLNDNLKDINYQNSKKIDESLKVIEKKFIDFDKDLSRKINEKFFQNDQNLLKVIDDKTRKQLEEFKKNLLRS